MRKIKEKRRNLRFPNNYPVKIIADKRVEYKGIIKDINQKGAFIVIKGPMVANDGWIIRKPYR